MGEGSMGHQSTLYIHLCSICYINVVEELNLYSDVFESQQRCTKRSAALELVCKRDAIGNVFAILLATLLLM